MVPRVLSERGGICGELRNDIHHRPDRERSRLDGVALRSASHADAGRKGTSRKKQAGRRNRKGSHRSRNATPSRNRHLATHPIRIRRHGSRRGGNLTNNQAPKRSIPGDAGAVVAGDRRWPLSDTNEYPVTDPCRPESRHCGGERPHAFTVAPLIGFR